MNYFGTSTSSNGHFMWELEGSEMFTSRIKLGNLPFNPEALPYLKHRDGDVAHYQYFGFTVLAICGSCNDTRPGSKSIFWLEGNFTPEEMKQKIFAIPIGKKIIEQMPFKIRW